MKYILNPTILIILFTGSASLLLLDSCQNNKEEKNNKEDNSWLIGTWMRYKTTSEDGDAFIIKDEKIAEYSFESAGIHYEGNYILKGKTLTFEYMDGEEKEILSFFLDTKQKLLIDKSNNLYKNYDIDYKNEIVENTNSDNITTTTNSDNELANKSNAITIMLKKSPSNPNGYGNYGCQKWEGASIGSILTTDIITVPEEKIWVFKSVKSEYVYKRSIVSYKVKLRHYYSESQKNMTDQWLMRNGAYNEYNLSEEGKGVIMTGGDVFRIVAMNDGDNINVEALFIEMSE